LAANKNLPKPHYLENYSKITSVNRHRRHRHRDFRRRRHSRHDRRRRRDFRRRRRRCVLRAVWLRKAGCKPKSLKFI
jgi:hypothetical protein